MAGDAFRPVLADAFGHQFAEHDGEIGDDDDDKGGGNAAADFCIHAD